MSVTDRCDRIGMWGMYAVGGFVTWLTGNPLMTCVVGGIGATVPADIAAQIVEGVRALAWLNLHPEHGGPFLADTRGDQ